MRTIKKILREYIWTNYLISIRKKKKRNADFWWKEYIKTFK